MITSRGLSQKCKHIYHLKSVYVINLNNKLKEKNIMVLIDAEKSCDQSQHLFLIKTFSKKQKWKETLTT